MKHLLGASLAIGLGILACSSDDAKTTAVDPPATVTVNPPNPTPVNPTPNNPTPNPNPPNPNPPPGGLHGTGTLETNIAEWSFTVADAEARYGVTQHTTTFEGELKLDIGSVANQCDDLGAGIYHKGSHVLSISISRDAATAEAAALTVGTYAFGNDGDVEVKIRRNDHSTDTCAFVEKALPGSLDPLEAPLVNTLEITTLTATHVAGNFELRDSGGTFVKGTFDTDLCGKSLPADIKCQP